jgi:hypothetical protein
VARALTRRDARGHATASSIGQRLPSSALRRRAALRVPIRCPNPRGFPVKAGESSSAPHNSKTSCFQRLCLRNRGGSVCLPCRRSRVRIPSALSKRPVFAGLFCVRSRLVPLHPVGLIPGLAIRRSSAASRKTAVCRPILVRPNWSHSAGPQTHRRSIRRRATGSGLTAAEHGCKARISTVLLPRLSIQCLNLVRAGWAPVLAAVRPHPRAS